MATSITSRLIGLLTLVSALIIGASVFLDYRFSRDEILERLRIESQDTIKAAVIDMESWLGSVEGSTRFLARILEQREYSRSGLEQMLKDIVANSEDIFGAAIALNPEQVDSPLGFAPYYFRRGKDLQRVDRLVRLGAVRQHGGAHVPTAPQRRGPRWRGAGSLFSPIHTLEVGSFGRAHGAGDNPSRYRLVRPPRQVAPRSRRSTTPRDRRTAVRTAPHA